MAQMRIRTCPRPRRLTAMRQPRGDLGHWESPSHGGARHLPRNWPIRSAQQPPSRLVARHACGICAGAGAGRWSGSRQPEARVRKRLPYRGRLIQGLPGSCSSRPAWVREQQPSPLCRDRHGHSHEYEYALPLVTAVLSTHTTWRRNLRAMSAACRPAPPCARNPENHPSVSHWLGGCLRLWGPSWGDTQRSAVHFMFLPRRATPIPRKLGVLGVRKSPAWYPRREWGGVTIQTLSGHHMDFVWRLSQTEYFVHYKHCVNITQPLRLLQAESTRLLCFVLSPIVLDDSSPCSESRKTRTAA